MKKSTLTLLVASFVFGCATGDVDAHQQRYRHNYLWHNGKHYPHGHKHHGHKQRHSQHHFKHHSAPPAVVAHVYVGSQHVTVDVEGKRYGDWAVSTAGRGYKTPQGVFHATRMAQVYYSKKYDNSPMPYSVFFSGGNALHGSYHVHSLGHPASHGCVRLLPEHAAELFALVEHYGMIRTRIIVSN